MFYPECMGWMFRVLWVLEACIIHHWIVFEGPCARIVPNIGMFIFRQWPPVRRGKQGNEK